jgi:hypothetical protein
MPKFPIEGRPIGARQCRIPPAQNPKGKEVNIFVSGVLCVFRGSKLLVQFFDVISNKCKLKY